jgi:magnesium-protoporphyrin IX monomethyl ester (oxidative) cyclase
MRVFRVTSEISRQVFPLELDIDHPAFRDGLEKLLVLNRRIADADEQGGITGKLKRYAAMAGVATTLARMYFLPVKPNEIPATSRLYPSY